MIYFLELFCYLYAEIGGIVYFILILPVMFHAQNYVAAQFLRPLSGCKFDVLFDNDGEKAEYIIGCDMLV